MILNELFEKLAFPTYSLLLILYSFTLGKPFQRQNRQNMHTLKQCMFYTDPDPDLDPGIFPNTDPDPVPDPGEQNTFFKGLHFKLIIG